MQKLIVVCGPTATGKTELAVRLCRTLSGEVISADSMQIYSELTIGTARPDETEMGGVPHHLLGFVPPEASFSVADYVAAARAAIDEIAARGRQPVVAGGTGLYITSLCDGVRFGAFKGDSEIREQLRREAEEKGGEVLLARLRGIDPEAAEIVLQSGAKLTMLPLDATHAASLSLDDAKALRGLHTPQADFAAEMIEHRVEVHNADGQMGGAKNLAPIHDALVVCAAIDPSVLTDVRFMRVDVDCSGGYADGQTLCDTRALPTKPRNCHVALDADPKKFGQILAERLR